MFCNSTCSSKIKEQKELDEWELGDEHAKAAGKIQWGFGFVILECSISLQSVLFQILTKNACEYFIHPQGLSAVGKPPAVR